MKLCIDINTEERAAAESEFEKNSPKNINLSVFGKSMENAGEKQTIKLKKRQKGRTRRPSHLTFDGFPKS